MNTYTNPIKKQGDFADPFILRYNGKYYLYGTNFDLRCWSSADLLNWTLEGPTISEDEFPGLGPWAPEIVYDNGWFYLYTSPSGTGHRVLRSDKPTGPFRKITDNVGHNIDGSVFIDDDGQWYFYWADDAGILCCKMDGPDQFGEPIHTGAFLHGWTEGPTVVKEDGLYYLTYCGNHYLSPGYRVNAAVSEHPWGPFRDCENNPILVNTTGEHIGLGHSSFVWGPDLVTRYIVYHNINPDLSRDLNIDVITFRDGAVHVAGPSFGKQPAPRLPLWQETIGKPLADAKPLPETGAAEVNILFGTGQYAVCFGSLEITFDSQSNTVQLSDGEKKPLPQSYDHNVLHCLLVRYDDQVKVFLDGRLLAQKDRGLDASSGLSFRGSLELGCCTVSNAAVKEIQPCYPIPCTAPASEKIQVNADTAGDYTLIVLAKSIQKDDSTIQWGKIVLSPLSVTSDCAEYQIPLQQGISDLSFAFGQGIVEPKKVYLLPYQRKLASAVQTLSITEDAGKAVLDQRLSASFQANVDLQGTGENSGEAGAVFCASQLALGGEGNDERLGINFFIGYSLSVKEKKLVLCRHQYNCQELASAELEEAQEIRIQKDLNHITVSAGGNVLMEYHDRNPLFGGRMGIRTIDCVCKRITVELLA